MTKKDFWYYFTDNCKEHFEQEFLLKNKNFSLAVLYGKYYEKILFEEGKEFNFEDWDKLLYKNKFLIYLENLLKKGELKMELNFDYEPRESEYNKGHIYYHFSDGYKRFSKENYKEGIGRLKHKWYSIIDERERRVFEDGAVEFILPENNFY